MKDIKRSEIFRLAAVLYADNNYEVSPSTIHRKIIESIFLDNNNKEESGHSIVDLIEKDYGFIFDYEEVIDLVIKGKDDYFLIGRSADQDILVSLTPKRINYLQSKLTQGNINFFINEFITLHPELIGALDGKGIIYQFLYEIFSNNISSFSKLIDYRKELDSAIDLDMSFNPVEKQIINAFLMWDNDGKNKAIFDISSYALEYCLITNQSSKNTFHLQNLRNKDFYLDTNVLFRAIGINGENRKNRTNTFLSKFNDAGENLIISRFTEAEYKSTIKHYVSLIAKKNWGKVNPKIFNQYKKESEFFDYYHKWRIGRNNDSLQLFEAHLISEYEGLKKKFKIKEDYQIPFDEKNEDHAVKINELAKDIFSFKNSESLYYGRFETAITDAKNILLIKNRRNGFYKNIFETKYFFISSDQGLRRWDFSQNIATPMVLLPSQWMSILLRYLNRTSDDFKSFVSFLNLSQNETKITNEKLQLILLGIGEITQEFDQQSSIIEIMIETKFKGILEKSFSEEEIIEHAKEFAKTKLEKDLDEANRQRQIALESLEAQKEDMNTALKELEIEKQVNQRSKVIEEENESLRNEIRDAKVKTHLREWKVPAYLSIVGVIVCLYFYYQLLFGDPKHYNYSLRFADWVDAFPENSTRRQAASTLYFLPGGAIIPLMLIIFNRLIYKKSIKSKIKEIEEKIHV